jgi:hypothetical protein
MLSQFYLHFVVKAHMVSMVAQVLTVLHDLSKVPKADNSVFSIIPFLPPKTLPYLILAIVSIQAQILLRLPNFHIKTLTPTATRGSLKYMDLSLTGNRVSLLQALLFNLELISHSVPSSCFLRVIIK